MNELLRCKNKKAKEIERILSEELEETVQIRKGAPDARYKEGYFAYMTTFNGFQAVGTEQTKQIRLNLVPDTRERVWCRYLKPNYFSSILNIVKKREKCSILISIVALTNQPKINQT